MWQKLTLTKIDKECWNFILGCAWPPFSSSYIMVDALIGQGTHRPASLRSVASNSSVSSGVSLTRRSRTRTRPKTAGSSGRADSLTASPISELPYIDTRFVLGSSRVPPSTMVTELQPCSDRDEAIEVQNDDTSLVDERIAVMDGVSEGSQSPPMTPRLVRIRTFACIVCP